MNLTATITKEFGLYDQVTKVAEVRTNNLSTLIVRLYGNVLVKISEVPGMFVVSEGQNLVWVNSVIDKT